MKLLPLTCNFGAIQYLRCFPCLSKSYFSLQWRSYSPLQEERGRRYATRVSTATLAGMVGASDWIRMGWGMGVSPEAGGAGGKRVKRKRAID